MAIPTINDVRSNLLSMSPASRRGFMTRIEIACGFGTAVLASERIDVTEWLREVAEHIKSVSSRREILAGLVPEI